MKRSLELYMSNKINLREALRQIKMLLDMPLHQIDNKVLLINFMRDLKRSSIETESAHLKKCYLNLCHGIAKMVNNRIASPLSWKEALFTSSQKTRVSLSDITLIGKFHLNAPCEFSEFTTLHSDHLQLSCAMGITSTDNRADFQDKTKLSLDADYSLGATGTTVDGVGVYKDPEANKRILKAAKLCAKYLTLIADNYNTADDLYEAMPTVFSKTKNMIQDYFKNGFIESSCCVVTKIFPVDETSCEVITGSVGDCVAFAWDPVSKEITLLAIARQFDYGRMYNPVSITDKLAGNMLQTTRKTLQNSAFIFRLTDGAWQMLPNIQSNVQYEDSIKRKFIDMTLDAEKIKEILITVLEHNPDANEQDYCDALIKEIIANVNATKLSIQKILPLIKNDYLLKFSEHYQMDVAKIQYGEFIEWLTAYDPQLFDELNLTLCRLEYVPELMSSAKIIEILNSLSNNLDMGDDVTISVQSCKSAANLSAILPKDRGCTLM